MMLQATESLADTIGVAPACEVLNVSRSRWYRARRPGPAPRVPPALPGNAAERALTPAEKVEVRQTLDSERFQDCAPRQVFATLLDEGIYLCSWRQMYRILAEHHEVRERRDQLRHPIYARPELLATHPNQLWSWDITRLLGPVKWTYYYLFVILDVFSRYVVGWMVTGQESAVLAEELITATCEKQNIGPDQLTIHADRGGTMLARPLALLLADLGVTRSHSRPHVSNDNPYSESQFKTMKYRPDYPKRFGSQVDATSWARAFFAWYNNRHHHTGLGLLTPVDVHSGRAEAIIIRRQQVLQQAYQRHPGRFVKGVPVYPALPTAVWINPPTPSPDPNTDTTIRH